MSSYYQTSCITCTIASCKLPVASCQLCVGSCILGHRIVACRGRQQGRLLENPSVHVKCMRRQARRATCEIYAHTYVEGISGRRQATSTTRPSPIPHARAHSPLQRKSAFAVEPWPVDQNSWKIKQSAHKFRTAKKVCKGNEERNMKMKLLENCKGNGNGNGNGPGPGHDHLQAGEQDDQTN